MLVYDSYENTIALLKKYGIYSESNLDVECIQTVHVTNYYPGVDTDDYSMDELNNMNLESVSADYTDKDQIKELLESADGSEFYGQWYDYSGRYDNQYGMEVILSTPRDRYGSTSVYYNFKLGKVPEFVKKDTN